MPARKGAARRRKFKKWALEVWSFAKGYISFSKLLVYAVLYIDYKSTMTTLDLCRISVANNYTGSLPYLTALIAFYRPRPLPCSRSRSTRARPRTRPAELHTTRQQNEIAKGGSKMKEIIVKRLGALLSVKSLVTLLLSGVFAYLAITGQTSQEFMTVYTVVIAFYFGTQTQKISDAVDKTLKGE